MFPYGKQTIDEDDIDAVAEVLRGDFLTTGPAITAFEEALCSAIGAEHSVVCGNGTQALHLACVAAGIGEGDVAIVPSVTFLATANAVRYCGADVLFADVDPETGLMTPDTLEDALSRACDAECVKAVLPVHLKGQCVDMEPLSKIARAKGLRIITDSCHALGSDYRSGKAGDGTYEDMACFSFHPVKTIAMGEGGAITTNDAVLAEKMRLARGHGMEKTPEVGPWAYEMKALGYNYRQSDIHCALGLSQMKKLPDFIAKRRALVALYNELLADLAPVLLPPMMQNYDNPSWHLYAVRIDFEALGMSRAALMEALLKEGVGTQVHYIPVHSQPYYQGIYGEQHLPGAQTYYEKTLSLPLYPSLKEDDVRQIVSILRKVIS